MPGCALGATRSAWRSADAHGRGCLSQTPALQAAGISAVGSRRAWPHEVLRRVLDKLVADTPRDLIAQELWVQSLDSQGWLV